MDIDQLDIATDGCRQAAGESVELTKWHYKADKRDKYPKTFNIVEPHCDSCGGETFERGQLLGNAQNFARELMELPSNMLTPVIFADRAKTELEGLGVTVNVYDGDWIQEQKMNAFWSVAKGSSEPPRMVELIYEGEGASVDNTFCMVGKGVTFDTGGISIKPSANMGDMRADMGGAAVTLAAMRCVELLELESIEFFCLINLLIVYIYPSNKHSKYHIFSWKLSQSLVTKSKRFLFLEPSQSWSCQAV